MFRVQHLFLILRYSFVAAVLPCCLHVFLIRMCAQYLLHDESSTHANYLPTTPVTGTLSSNAEINQQRL